MKAEGKKPRKSLNDTSPFVLSRKPKNSVGLPFDKYKLGDPIIKPVSYDPETSYNWRDFLDNPDFISPPVYVFPTAPLNNIWAHISPNMKIEVPNFEYQSNSSISSAFWVATVIKVCGYKILLRYEGSTVENSIDFWMNLCCHGVHPIGWCAQNTIPLVPPKSIQDLHPEWKSSHEWKSFLAKRLTGSRTLPGEFFDLVKTALSSKFQVGMNIEVLDRAKISQVKPAIIKEVIGHRLRLSYLDSEDSDDKQSKSSEESDDESEEDNDFWAHERSPLLHPVGWAISVGHAIECTEEYREKCQKVIVSGLYDWSDALPDLFPSWTSISQNPNVGSGLFEFQCGMKLEAVDPLDLSSIVVATVEKVLKDGYLMLSFDGNGDQFCYHRRSPYIFPIGFCDQHGIKLSPPKNFLGPKFNWPEYLKETNSLGAPTGLFNTELATHFFIVGQKLEATDLMDPHLVCVATIADVKGRLLRIHFDGWDDSFDQWLDCEAPEIYPVGWCEMVGLKLEAAKEETPIVPKKRVKPNKPSSNSTSQKKRVKPPLTLPKEEQMECRPATAGMKSAELPTDMIAMEKESPGEICLPTSCKAFVPNGSEPVIAIDNFYPQ